MNASRLFFLLSITLIAIGIAIPLLCGVTRASAWLEGGVVIAIILSALIYHHIIKPLHVAEMGMDLLREQDYASRLAPVGQRDADRIVELFNRLMDRLKAEHLRMLETDHLLTLIIEASPVGIISMDCDDRVNLTNSAARNILGSDPEGLSLKQLAAMSAIGQECASLTPGESRVVRFTDTMVYRLARLAYMDRGMSCTFLLIEPLTEEVRRAERDAYGKVIRTIGHEVNNSLASISSLLSLLLEIKPWGEEDTDLTEAVEASCSRARHLSNFISAYAQVVKIPELNLQEKNPGEFLHEIEPFLRSMTSGANIGLDIIIRRKDLPMINMDVMLLEQAIINIVKNSIESIGSERKDGHIDLAINDSKVLTITDNGSGLSPESSRSLFTPFFSTKSSGRGLGLMFVAEILRRHGATFTLATDAETRLTTFTIRF